MVDILKDYPVLSAALGFANKSITCDCKARYKTFQLRAKVSQKSRTIEAPCPHLKIAQRALLDRVLSSVEPHRSAMAFARGRSVAANARLHQGSTFLFATDIRSFFSSITAEAVIGMLRRRYLHLSPDAMTEIVSMVMLNGRLPQGAPTSPHIANLVMYEFDDRCHSFGRRVGAVYSRYADDISISGNDAIVLSKFEDVVTEEVRLLGMEMHKTRHCGPSQSRVVTGLDIGSKSLRPTRAFRRKTAALVRMSIKYPEKMSRHRRRITGYLAFWYDVNPADLELAELLVGMQFPKWASRVREAAAQYSNDPDEESNHFFSEYEHPSDDGEFSDDGLPF